MFILKFGQYITGNEIGSKFYSLDDVNFYETCYEKMKFVEFEGGITYECDHKANDVIHKKYEVKDLPLEKRLLKIVFKREGNLENIIIYTDNELYVCNSKGDTIQKFRKL